MTLGEKQRLFVRLIGDLIEFAYVRGYEFSFGDAYRDPRLHGDIGKKVAYGHRNSNHKMRLAVDLNLFKDGVFLTTDKDHEPLGLYWETLHEDCSWGGHFNDGNHYSMKHNGMR
jgi:hypothetical protein